MNQFDGAKDRASRAHVSGWIAKVAPPQSAKVGVTEGVVSVALNSAPVRVAK